MRMKTKKTVCICISLFASLGLWSCNKENAETPRLQNNELPGNAIGFSVTEESNGELRSAGDVTDANLNKMTVYAHYTGTYDFSAVASATTPNLMFNQSVTGSSGTWTYSPLKYWPADNQRVSFFAIAPAPGADGIVLNTTGSGSYTGYPSFTVTPPPTPSMQKDIVVASALNETKGSGTVGLTFNHAMAKVSFSASYTGSMPPSGYVKVKELRLTQVAAGGTLSFTSTGFLWSEVSGAAGDYTLTQANGLINEILPANPSSKTISTTAGTLMLVPQTALSAEVQLVATFYNGVCEKDITLTATLSTANWEAGKQTTYNLQINMDNMIIIEYPYVTRTVNDGASYTFTAPKSGTYLLEAWGAGGSAGYHNSGSPGSGGYSKGTVFLKKDQKIYVYVGECTSYGWGDGSTTNTFNGGGRNSGKNVSNDNAHLSGIGGGATDFRLKPGTWNEDKSLNSRILVAAGGGGGGNHSPYPAAKNANGGAGGGLNGGEGYSAGTNAGSYNSQGGSQTKGGDKSSLTTDSNPQNGSFGKGGGVKLCSAGAGGGYYGGGAGSHTTNTGATLVGGAGGSSFISGMAGCRAINPSSTSNPRATDGMDTALNYSDTDFGATSPTWANGADIVFTNCSMIDGEGYEWNTGAKGISTKMPNPTTGDGMTGNTGNGYARITLLIQQ